jgi:hypothetical protein
MFKELEGQFRKMVDAVDYFYTVLGPRNWCYHEDLSVDEVDRLIRSADRPEEAERGLIEFYKRPDNLGFLTLRLRRFEALRKRVHLINLARDDYLSGRYYACTLSLLTIMDGFVNELDKATRRGLHAREPEDFDVYDSVIAHHYGLAHAHQTFRRSFKDTVEEPVYELYRNGILHGVITNYNNDVVATKAWNRMYAVADWGTARLKQPKPPEKLPSWREVWGTFADLARQRQATESWQASVLEPGDEGFAEDGCMVACDQYLRLWQRRNYGHMAKMLGASVQKGQHLEHRPMPLLGHTQLHQHDRPLSPPPRTTTAKKPPPARSRTLGAQEPGVTHLPEHLSHTYRTRVPKLSPSNRNPSDHHEPETHKGPVRTGCGPRPRERPVGGLLAALDRGPELG